MLCARMAYARKYGVLDDSCRKGYCQYALNESSHVLIHKYILNEHTLPEVFRANFVFANGTKETLFFVEPSD